MCPLCQLCSIFLLCISKTSDEKHLEIDILKSSKMDHVIFNKEKYQNTKLNSSEPMR